MFERNHDRKTRSLSLILVKDLLVSSMYTFTGPLYIRITTRFSLAQIRMLQFLWNSAFNPWSWIIIGIATWLFKNSWVWKSVMTILNSLRLRRINSKVYVCLPHRQEISTNSCESLEEPLGHGLHSVLPKRWDPTRDHELKVFFMNDCNWRGKRLINILEAANEWHRKCPKVPKFVEIGSAENCDIRVLFNSTGRIETILGTDARREKKADPTMWLDLTGDSDSFIAHVVLHEFGHALGFVHEHQCSLFLKHYKTFLNTDQMKTDLPGRYQRDIAANLPDTFHSKYDPDSVMHYWFPLSWLKPEYQTIKEERIESTCESLCMGENDSNRKRQLFDELCQVLRGIVRRRGNWPTELSRSDVEYAEVTYDIRPANASSAPGQQGASSDASALPRRAKKNRVAADSGSDDDTSATVSGPAKGLGSESGHDEDEGTIDDVVPRKQLGKPATGSGPPKIPPPPEQHGGETQSTPSEQQENFGQFKYRDEEGEVTVYHLTRDFSPDWKLLGQMFGFKRSFLTNIATVHRSNPVECFDAVISHWESSGSVPKTAYVVKWEGLIQALRDMGNVSRKVDELEDALKSKL